MSYRPGDWYVSCDQCGKKKYRSECRMQWNNLFVCPKCYDPKHPQLEIKAKKESVPDIVRPEGTDSYLVDPTTW
jgi:hypothetical protein